MMSINYTVTNTQVAVKYRQNVGSLSIDMSADNRTTTLGRHIDRHIGRVSVDILTNALPICRPIYRVTHLGQHIDWHSTNMSTDISGDTWPICRLIRRSTVGRYAGRGVHKIHTFHLYGKILTKNEPIRMLKSTSTSTYNKQLDYNIKISTVW